MKATEIVGTVDVQSAYAFEGNHWLEVGVSGWEGVLALPAGLAYQGREYGQTGWNSDRNVAYYSTAKRFARAI